MRYGNSSHGTEPLVPGPGIAYMASPFSTSLKLSMYLRPYECPSPLADGIGGV